MKRTGLAWSAQDAGWFVAMWGVMMAAMMLPSAMPMVLLYRTVSGKLSGDDEHVIPPSLFAAVYLAVWLLAGIPVYATDVAVARLAAQSVRLSGAVPYGVGIVLIAAGAYQLSAFKRECLRKCKSPLQFLTEHWQNGYFGTLRVALRHALYCLGCCGALMTILVVAGAMNLVWVLIITVIVFAEKVLPYGEWTARATGAALILLGAGVMLHPDLERSLRRMPSGGASAMEMR